MIFEERGGGVKFGAVRVDIDDFVDGDIIASSPPPPLLAVATPLLLLEPMLMVLLFLEGTETCLPTTDDASTSCCTIRSLAVSSTALERALLNASALTCPWHAPIAICGVNFCTTT